MPESLEVVEDVLPEEALPDPAQEEADSAWGELDALAEVAADDAEFEPSRVRRAESAAEAEGESEAKADPWRAKYEESERRNASLNQMINRVQHLQQQMMARYEEQRQIDLQLAEQVRAEQEAARIPDRNQDPGAWLDARLKAHEDVIGARLSEQEARRQAEVAAQQQAAVNQAMDKSLRQAEQDWPEFPDALRHLAQVTQYQLQAAGYDPNQVGLYLEQTATRAIMSGQDPGEVLYQLAVNSGYVYEESQKQEAKQDPAHAARQRRSREASSRQGPRSSVVQSGNLRVEDVEAMSDKEVQDLIAQGDEGFEKLFSPYFVS